MFLLSLRVLFLFSEQPHKNELWIEQQGQCLYAFTADRQYIIVTGLCTQEDETYGSESIGVFSHSCG